ncbi:tRNA dihydrouridine synthase [Balneatrix alpica]|uniref:tRNA dihydrouridine synthase n=1 Tax=Balneatrix alpica TaxID=75684 RepID=UPI0027386324|nr:tRNA-dihydrouridine synthase family protein [Balneatrix alpica]
MITASTPGRLMLAPMEGLVDVILRDLLTRMGGVDTCVTEFIRVTDTLLPNRTYYRMCPELLQGARTAAGVPVWVQLLGSDPEALARNARRAAKLGAPVIDLNFGCPAKTVNRHCGGAALLVDPERIHRIVAAVRAAVPPQIPVTAKMRLGLQDRSLMFDNASAIESAGASLLTIHARTKVEGYRPPAYWEEIARIGERVQIPLVANGEVWTLEDYDRCRQQSGCVDVMLGRGLVSQPWLALQIRARQQGLPIPEPSLALLSPWLLAFWSRCLNHLSFNFALGRSKQWLKMLCRGVPALQAELAELQRETCPMGFGQRLLQLSDSEAARQYQVDLQPSAA